MKRLNLILNGKGGVGKSFFAVNLVQFLKDKGVAHVAIDSDNENSTLKRFHPDALFLDLDNRRELDGIFAALEKSDLVVMDYLVPVLDIPVRMRAENGVLREQPAEIALYALGLPCPWCRGRIDVNGIRYETATEAERQFRAVRAATAEQRGVDGAQYWGGTPPPELTVG